MDKNTGKIEKYDDRDERSFIFSVDQDDKIIIIAGRLCEQFRSQINGSKIDFSDPEKDEFPFVFIKNGSKKDEIFEKIGQNADDFVEIT